MSLSIGIIGLPNVGKSTLFNALVRGRAEASNYPFCTIDPNVGIVKVPDERLEKLAAVSKSEKIIPGTIKFIDIAGLVKGAHLGQGLGNKFLSHIRECDAICQVVRAFPGEEIIHIASKIDPVNDCTIINLELIFSDLYQVEKHLERIIKQTKSGSRENHKEKELLEKIKIQLEAGRAIREMTLTDEENKSIKSWQLLTAKPIIYILNISNRNVWAENSEQLNKNDLTFNQNISFFSATTSAERLDGEMLVIDAKLEEEISNLPEAERQEFIKELGLKESSLDKLIKASYKLLGLITFFTTGKKETRAWTVRNQTKAPQAAGVIHTDFEKNFIRAEVINWHDFIKAGSEARARELGLLRIEGKDYFIQDGDVCHFLVDK